MELTSDGECIGTFGIVFRRSWCRNVALMDDENDDLENFEGCDYIREETNIYISRYYD